MRPLFASVVAVVVASSAAPALACSCRCTSDAAVLVRETPVFFRGRAVAESVAGPIRRYAFEVVAVHKGPVATRVTVETPLHSAACGAEFALQREVLVGAFLHEGRLRTNLCTQFCIGQRGAELARVLESCRPGTPCPPDN